MNYCCENCFQDKFLEKQIQRLSTNIGNCDFCESKDSKIIEPILLQDFFEQIIDIYEESESGIMLSEHLNCDWKMFDKGLNKFTATNLISEILDNKDYLTNKYINSLEKLSIDIWDNFKKELKHNNRYFPNDKEFNKENLKNLFEYFELFNYPQEVYRARINTTDEILAKERMGKPPYKKASQGRANPIGISYLYVASNEKTAISEIRPHKGDKVTVAKINLPTNFRLFDLRSAKNHLSPFDFSDNVLEELYKDIDLLERFSEELSKPVLPREAHLEYLSSQYLSELIKHNGFDGLIYKSSVGDGYNIVIFTDFDLEFLELKEYNIKNTVIEFN